MNKILLILFCLISLISCNKSTNKKCIETNSIRKGVFVRPNIKYTVLEQSCIKQIKSTYTVQIEGEYNEKQLDSIADYLQKTDTNRVPSIFISYYLPNQNINSFNYALSERGAIGNRTEIHFKKSPKISPVKKPYDGAVILGKWRPGTGGEIITIYKKGNKFFWLDEYDSDPTDLRPLRLKKLKGRNAFKIIGEDSGEEFVIKSDGLYGYSYGDEAIIYNPI